MKKIIIGLGVLTSLTFQSAFGTGTPSPRVLKTFQSEFKNATEVVWEENCEFIKARFGLNNFRVVAFFNLDGELISTARTILFNQLPLTAMNALTKRFNQSAFYDVTEYTNGEIFYELIVDTGAKRFRVRVSALGNIVTEQKMKS